MYELDNLNRQLNLLQVTSKIKVSHNCKQQCLSVLQNANQKLQDTNDGLREFGEAAAAAAAVNGSPRSSSGPGGGGGFSEVNPGRRPSHHRPL